MTFTVSADLALTPAPAHWGWISGQINVTRLKSAAMFVTGKCAAPCKLGRMKSGVGALTTAVTCSPLRLGQFRGKIKGNGV